MDFDTAIAYDSDDTAPNYVHVQALSVPIAYADNRLTGEKALQYVAPFDPTFTA